MLLDNARTTAARPTGQGRSSSASSVRVFLVGAFVARAGLADTGTLHEGACERQAANRRRHGLRQRLEPTREGRCPERGSHNKGKDDGRIMAGRAQDECHPAEEDGPGPCTSFDAFGERERRCRHDQKRRECAVQTTPNRSARRESRSGSQIPARRSGGERALHGDAPTAGAEVAKMDHGVRRSPDVSGEGLSGPMPRRARTAIGCFVTPPLLEIPVRSRSLAVASPTGGRPKAFGRNDNVFALTVKGSWPRRR